MFYHLPPAGNPICLTANVEIALPSFLAEQNTRFYNSGTAALAAAIKASIAVSKKSNHIGSAEVILPAYACPDLVSAVVYAGARPVLVDLESDRPWLNLLALEGAVGTNTVAIVAVNLFGISERWPQLCELAEQKNIVLIEDSAQYFPGGDERPDWQGDLVVFSFGRGKPASLLGGGAVLSRDAGLSGQLPEPASAPVSMSERWSFSLKARLYNAMIVPTLYWLPQAIPFLHLGETRYHTLQAIEAMDPARLELLAVNIANYQADIKASRRCQAISSMLASQEKVNDLPLICKMPANRRLLRYPILLDAASRDRVYQMLKQAGLGASIMYPASLPKISGLSHLLDDKQRFPNAEAFASQLLTLPTHSRVSESTIDEIGAVLESI